MSSLATLFTRRLALVASRRTLPRTATFARAAMATINLPDNEKVRTEPENPQGPMMGGYDAFLDDMIAKTETMELGSLCAMGGLTPGPGRSALRQYPGDFGLEEG